MLISYYVMKVLPLCFIAAVGLPLLPTEQLLLELQEKLEAQAHQLDVLRGDFAVLESMQATDSLGSQTRASGQGAFSSAARRKVEQSRAARFRVRLFGRA